MNQNPEPAVQPRRNLLTALWVSAVGLLAAPKLIAAATPPPPPEPEYELTLLVGRLCLDRNFRQNLFKSDKLDGEAKLVLADQKMVTKKENFEKVDKILRAHNSPANPVQDACASVDAALTTLSIWCPQWPC